MAYRQSLREKEALLIKHMSQGICKAAGLTLVELEEVLQTERNSWICVGGFQGRLQNINWLKTDNLPLNYSPIYAYDFRALVERV